MHTMAIVNELPDAKWQILISFICLLYNFENDTAYNQNYILINLKIKLIITIKRVFYHTRQHSYMTNTTSLIPKLPI